MYWKNNHITHSLKVYVHKVKNIQTGAMKGWDEGTGPHSPLPKDCINTVLPIHT